MLGQICTVSFRPLSFDSGCSMQLTLSFREKFPVPLLAFQWVFQLGNSTRILGLWKETWKNISTNDLIPYLNRRPSSKTYKTLEPV